MQPNASGSPAPDSYSFEHLRSLLRSSSEPLGERLLVLGSGPTPVTGALGGILALDSSARTVLIVAFGSLSGDSAPPLADDLDRVAQLNPEELIEAANELASPVEIQKLHADFFEVSDKPPADLNRKQRAIVVVEEEPDDEAWKALLVELGPRLAGVYLLQGDRLVQLQIPHTFKRTPLAEWGNKPVVILGLVAAVSVALTLWVTRAFDRGFAGAAAGQPLIAPPREVARGVAGGATQTNWIGQRRIVQTSSGTLLAFFATQGGLQIVSDEANQGRTWAAPKFVSQIMATSFDVAIDRSDRLHIGFRNERRVAYASITRNGSEFEVSPIIELDSASANPTVDVAFDSGRALAHVVWVKDEDGEQPFWAAVSNPSQQPPSLVDSQSLADAGKTLTVLANVGVGANSEVLATFRRGGDSNGWFSRSLDGTATGGFVWSPEETLPTRDVLFGAATMGFDAKGQAHLVLRDSSTFALDYLQRTQRGGWTASETAVDAQATEEIDFPSVSPDAFSQLVYLFFQDTRSAKLGQIKVAIRDPVGGWSSPSPVISEPSFGALYPTSISPALGQTMMLSTTQGDLPSVQATRVSAP